MVHHIHSYPSVYVPIIHLPRAKDLNGNLHDLILIFDLRHLNLLLHRLNHGDVNVLGHGDMHHLILVLHLAPDGKSFTLLASPAQPIFNILLERGVDGKCHE